MTCILASQGQNFPQHQKGYMPPIPAYQSGSRQEKASVSNLRSRRQKSTAVTKSLNANARNLES